MVPGGTSQEVTQLNIESLWSGGPFSDPAYNGGNHQQSEQAAVHQSLLRVRQAIFQSPNGQTGDTGLLAVDAGAYGSYASAGNLITTMNVTGSVSNYFRWLDLDEAVARTSWTQGSQSISRESFCAHPTQSCTQRTFTTSRTTLPAITYAFCPLSLVTDGLPAPSVTCLDSSTLQLTGLVAAPGMAYEILAKVGTVDGSVICTPAAGTESWITWVGGTNFDLDAGDEAHSFSFKGPDPHSSLVQLLSAASKPASALFQAHLDDLKATFSSESFSLTLGQGPSRSDLAQATSDLIDAYQIAYPGTTSGGNLYLENLLFNYGRGSGRMVTGTLGRLIIMNYWPAESTGLDLTKSLFDYMEPYVVVFEKNWAPRGAYTAQVLYNISRGWVVHNELNVFGHTGMKAGGPLWANYPEAAAWMMIHVWDHFDYTNDVAWWKSQGWPLLKGVAEFQLDKLIPDLRFNDSTLIVNPCNSPEQSPITEGLWNFCGWFTCTLTPDALGCSHAMQLIWQLFNAVEKGFAASGDTDTAFLQEVRDKRARMDKGIHIGSWGQLQEWKVDLDSPTDTHRHLSHLIGVYPGYAVSGYTPSIQGPIAANGTKTRYTTQQVIDAATVSLIHRGNGTGPDADSGWEKVWRAAMWAQLDNEDEFYHELTYALYENFAANLFSVYDSSASIFQIDANFGFTGAVMLLPALPKQWADGSIRGARVRGSISVDMQWAGGRLAKATLKVDKNARSRAVRVVYQGRQIASFSTSPGKMLLARANQYSVPPSSHQPNGPRSHSPQINNFNLAPVSFIGRDNTPTSWSRAEEIEFVG
ncbi:glycoside hydrolase family 95 protein [Pleurotus ostreatus PC15]|uniref:Glycoside hydrolase family 95 protein n=1 Tax=Pleurotus ostreatus (strain PC15) TaxID=1137138 RepID=A0A067N8Q5_PLEO1|nr:glycoside hydrolase family 95 protein [Pleurotus ostreatus PC15]